PNSVLRTETTAWTQDNTSLTYMLNPRATRQTVTLDGGASVRKDFTYKSDGSGNIWQVIERPFSSSTAVLRTTTTDYYQETNAPYASANLTNLPSVVSITDGTGAEVARTEFGYDEYDAQDPITTYPGTITNHDPAYNSQTITVRGNRTTVRRKFIEENRY